MMLFVVFIIYQDILSFLLDDLFNRDNIWMNILVSIACLMLVGFVIYIILFCIRARNGMLKVE